MPRYALKIEYDGTPFCGWQMQKNTLSVQGALEAALQKLTSRAVRTAAAGRTDSGVHAYGQVAHCDLPTPWEEIRLASALNYHLRPHPVAIVAAAEVDSDWHARFSAIARSYIYRLFIRTAPLILEKNRLWQSRRRLDLEAMQEGAAYLIGQHDFTTFRAVACQALSPIKTLDCLEITAIPYHDGTLFTFHTRARSFLHSQVRSLVGSLEKVGTGAWPAHKIKEALNAKDRAACGPVAPACGLYLADVSYEKNPFIARLP